MELRQEGPQGAPRLDRGGALARLEADLVNDGYRLTRSRRAILGILVAFERPFTATELQAAVTARQPGVGRASIYRTLLLLEERGYVEKLHQSGSEHYTLCLSTRHHHHLTCTRCGRTEELPLGDGVDVLATLDAAARALGYLPRTHVLAVYGLCPACQDAAQQPEVHPGPADVGPETGMGHDPQSRHPIGRRARRAPPSPS